MNCLKTSCCIIALLLALVSCKKSSGSSPAPAPAATVTTRSIVLSYFSPASSPSDISNPIFLISRGGGGSGFNGGTVIRAYTGSNCDTLLVTQTIPSYTTTLSLTVAVGAPGAYQVSMNMTDPFTGLSECSVPISYTYFAPTAPTSIDLLSETSPSSNPNPKIRVNGIGLNKVEIYLDSVTCSGTAFVTSSNSVFILPPLQNGAHALYAKTLSTTGVRSVCSPKLLDYQSLYSFGLGLTITTNPLTFDYTNIESDDVDGDGNADFVYTKSTTANSGIYFGTGTGSFGNLTSLYFSGVGTAIKIADVDGDGKKDTLMGDDNRNLYLFHNNGSRSFTKTTLESLGYSAFDSINYIEFIDVNGDGKNDIVIGAPRNGKVYLKLGYGDGTFQAAVDLMGGVNITNFQVVDVNHDSYPDLVARGASNYKIYLNNGSGSFSLSFTVSTTIAYGQSYVADINGDGWPDIITADGTQVKTLLNNQTGGFGAETTTTLAYSLYPTSLKVVDLDGDGKKDLLFYDITNTAATVFTGNSDGSFNYPLLYPIKSQGPITIMDINNDGKNDVFGSSVLIQN